MESFHLKSIIFHTLINFTALLTSALYFPFVVILIFFFKAKSGNFNHYIITSLDNMTFRHYFNDYCNDYLSGYNNYRIFYGCYKAISWVRYSFCILL